MKKIFILMIALMMSFTTMNAQTAIETPKIMDNWYIGVGGQVTTPLDFNGVFPLNGSAAVTLGKELTPIFGVNVEVGYVVGDGFGEAEAVLCGPVDAVVVADLLVAVVEAAEDVAVFPRFLDVGAEPFVGEEGVHF